MAGSAIGLYSCTRALPCCCYSGDTVDLYIGRAACCWVYGPLEIRFLYIEDTGEFGICWVENDTQGLPGALVIGDLRVIRGLSGVRLIIK